MDWALRFITQPNMLEDAIIITASLFLLWILLDS